MKNIERIGRVVMRTPVLPLENIYKNLNFSEIAEDQLFLSALFMASPTLYEEVLRYREGKIKSEKEIRKIEESITKYFLRMSSRCTPFGLFSVCGSVKQDLNNNEIKGNIVLPSTSEIKRYSRLDMNYLCSLSQYISKLPEVSTKLVYYTNFSLYKMGNMWRYVEYYYSKGNRLHQISSIEQNIILNKIIEAAKKGVSLEDVLTIIRGIDDECDEEEISEFFMDVINANILISELEPSITGNDFLTQIIHKLEGLDTPLITQITAVLRETNTLLKQVDSMQTTGDLIGTYKKITSLLKIIPVDIDESKLFQIDSFWDSEGDQHLDSQTGINIDKAVDILQRISPPSTSENLRRFTTRFRERYEDQEISIMHALDTESGIGYLQDNQTQAQAPTHFDLKWGDKESFLYSRLQECLMNGDQEIVLTDHDIESLQNKGASQDPSGELPPSFSALFRIVKKEGDSAENILIETIGGSSAAGLLGRFSSNDHQICSHVQHICSEEERINEDVIFAEIVHLPQSRIGNILLHPPFRKFEIPYLGTSSLPIENQLILEDLMVSVKNEKIILRSKSLNKIIIPRLSNAHNYSANGQPIYHFLCDLQYQNVRQGLYFDWGGLNAITKFLPRITYKNIILQPSRWNITQEDLTKHLNNKDNNTYQNFRNFCDFYKLPSVFLLSEADNDLPVHIENNQHIDMFLSTVKNKKNFILKEFLSPSENIQNKEEKKYNNQFIINYLKKEPTYKASLTKRKIKNTTKRTFSQDSEWIYFKIYSGAKTSNDILTQSIYSCVKKLKKEKLIDHWFFIRYADPHHHIRVRFHISEDTFGAREKIISFLIKSLRYYEKSGLIWNIVMDTYKREIERYRDIIEFAEPLFSFDSEATINYLRYTTDDESSWWMYGLKAIDQTFNDYGLDLNERHSVINQMSTSFNKEFNVSKPEKSWLDNLYRERLQDIKNLMESETSSEHYNQIYKILSVKSATSAIYIEKAFSQFSSEKIRKERIFEFLPSNIHMLMNRLCTTNARYEEMIMYNLIFKYYTSKIARIKYGK